MWVHALIRPHHFWHVSSHCTADLQAQHVPQPGTPSQAWANGPTWTLVLETSQWHRTPSVLCSQPKHLYPGRNNENKPSSHLPGEGLRGRSYPRATLLLMQLQPQLDLCLLCSFSRCPCGQAAAVYQHLLLPFSSWDLVWAVF